MSDTRELDARALEVAEAAAREAGALLLTHFGHLKRAEIRSKSAARDLATVADVESERLIVARIREAFPEHAIVAEEETLDAGRVGDGPRWFVDPLDGTVNFVHGLPMWCVSIGFYVDGRPRAACVHLPRLDETFTALAGGGTRLDGERVHVSAAQALGDSLLATGFPYLRHELPNNNLANFDRLFLQQRGVRRMGSAAIDLAYVAAGRLDGYWELHLGPHDLAAGVLLVREAGGVVTDVDGGEDWLAAGHLVAAGPALHPQLLEQVDRRPATAPPI